MQSLMTRLLLGGGGGFSPSALFSSGEQGAWYDPSDFGTTGTGGVGTLFQDSAGTTPVTAVEQPVGLVLDKSKGLVLGSELITPVANQDFSSDTGYWTKGVGVTISGGAANFSAASGYALYRGGVLPTGAPGAYYEVTFTVINYVSGSILPYLGTSPTFGTAVSANGTYTQRFCPTSGGEVGFNANVAFTGSIDNVSIKQVSGNHAYQSTSASRPTLRARYNLLTYSEDFSFNGGADQIWSNRGASASANTTTAPNGTTTADTLIENAATSAHGLYGLASAVVNQATSLTLSIYAKALTRSQLRLVIWGGGGGDTPRAGADFDLSAVTATASTNGSGWTHNSSSITPVGDGWYRCVANITIPSFAFPYFLISLGNAGAYSYAGDGTSGLYIWGAQLVRTAVFPSNTYQRIAAATDYATGAAFPPYLFFDGVDDSLLTNSVDFSATDKMTVWAGVTKLAAATQMLVELSADINVNNSAFTMAQGTDTWSFSSKGTSLVTATSGALYAPPVTTVNTGIGNISAPAATLRVNGAAVANNTQSQGTGNFGNYPLYIGRRNNATLPLNGNIYSLIIRGAETASPQLISTEQWVAQKSGITIP